MGEAIKISKEIKEVKPLWINFIIDLGYTEEQANNFAQGYEDKLKTLPLAEKLHALQNKHDSCMSAGFKKAKINEGEAFKKATSKSKNS